MPKVKSRKTRGIINEPADLRHAGKQERKGAVVKPVRERSESKGKLIPYPEAAAEDGPVLRSPVPESLPDLYRFLHIDPDYPVQNVVLGNNVCIRTVCVPLGNGRWLATEVQGDTAAVANSKVSAEDAVKTNVSRQSATHDFWANVSASELARRQDIRRIRKVGQIRTFSTPDPAEADWFARAVRRWRREGHK